MKLCSHVSASRTTDVELLEDRILFTHFNENTQYVSNMVAKLQNCPNVKVTSQGENNFQCWFSLDLVSVQNGQPVIALEEIEKETLRVENFRMKDSTKETIKKYITRKKLAQI